MEFVSIGLSDWAFLVHIAGLTQIVGYLFKNQIILRLLLLVGTGFYIAYYYLHPADPLWDAITWGVALTLANLVGLGAIFFDRLVLTMSAREREVFERLAPITPGQFRRLMRGAQFETATAETPLTEEAVTPDRLFFVIDGEVTVRTRRGPDRRRESGFIGEVSFQFGGGASATTTAAPGTRYVVWERRQLERLLDRVPSMRIVMLGLFAKDVAEKLRSG